MIFSNILVPVDGSEHSDRAVKYATEIALKFNAKITLLHVYSLTPLITSSTLAPTISDMTPDTINLISQKVKKDAKKILNQAKIIAQTKDVFVIGLLKEGEVVSEILNIVDAKKVDLIVMGARGLGGIKKLILGSISEAVVHKVARPVLIIR